MSTFAVTTAQGPEWNQVRGIREQAFWAEHASFMDGLVERGVVILGGPIESDDPSDIALLAVEAADENEVRGLFQTDPWTAHRIYRLKEVRAWTLWLDSRGPRASRTISRG